MNAANDPTIQPLSRDSELIALDTAFYQGQPIVPFSGLQLPFPVAPKQWQRPVVTVAWIPDDQLGAKPAGLQFKDGKRYTLTLRDQDGRYIAEDVPLLRLCVFNVGAPSFVSQQSLIYEPALIDWRRSFVRCITPAPSGVLRFNLVYQ